MVPQVVQDYLYELGCKWTGKGIAIELGSWLGATAAPLLLGLRTAGYDKPFYCYEHWKANMEQVGVAKHQGVVLTNNQDTLPIFLNNLKSIYSNIKAQKGSITDTIKTYNGGPIEICLFDAPKREPVFSESINALSPHWIPGVTILGLLDYYHYENHPEPLKTKLMAPVNFINAHPDSFEKIAEWPDGCSCVFFKYVKSLKS